MAIRTASISSIMSLAILVLGSPQTTDAETIAFSDGVFDSENWSLEVFQLDGNGGTFSAQQVSSGGVPGTFRQIDLVVNEGVMFSGLAIFNRFSNGIYDPGLHGAIQEISYHEDSRCLDSSEACGQRGGIALKQGGRVFVNGHYITPAYGWAPFDVVGQTAADFHYLDDSQSQHPDFSATAPPIEFGFFRGNWQVGGGISYSTSTGTDNWTVIITTGMPPTSVRPHSWGRIKAHYGESRRASGHD